MKIETPIEYCPHCQANLRGEPIPADMAHHYGGTHWLRKIGVVCNDRVSEWACPDCHGTWESDWTI